MTLTSSTKQADQETVVVSIRLPLGLAIEIGKLRVETRTNNATVITELLVEALTARGISIPEAKIAAPKVGAPEAKVAAAPKPTAKKQPPGPQVVMTRPAKSAAKAIKEAKAARTEERQLPLPVVPAVKEVTVADTVRVVDEAVVRPPAHEDLEAFFGFTSAFPAVKVDTRTDAEKGFVFLDPHAPLDLSIFSQTDEEEEDPNPFAGLDLPIV